MKRKRRKLTLWLKEATERKSFTPFCPFGARFPASSTNINLIKRQWLASEQTNMLISIDEGAWEQFICINEVKNSAKQSYPSSCGMPSQPHAGLPNDLRMWTWAELNRLLEKGFVQQLCTVIIYYLWSLFKILQIMFNCPKSDFIFKHEQMKEELRPITTTTTYILFRVQH